MKKDPYIGTVIEEKYSVDRKIGEGGMGAVYVGTQKMVDRPVAIKLLHTNLSTHERFKQRFEVEARAIGRLNHPNCITIYDFGFSQDLNAFYMVMEYLEGDPMHTRVVQGVSAQEAVTITKQIALALDHAHHQGILHRDLKPENIILSKMTDGSELVKVLDFGIARIFEDDKEQTTEETNRLTHAGEVFGTPAYISPEQARGERHLSPASDLYSLGVMLFEMLEGRLPYWGETAIETIMQHLQDPIPQLTRLDVPQGLKDIVNRLMSKQADQRFQSGKELSEALRPIEVQFESGVAKPARTPAASQAYDMGPTSKGLDFDTNEWEEVGETIASPPPASALARDAKPQPPQTRQAPSAAFTPPPSRGQLHDTDEAIHTGEPQRNKVVVLALAIVFVCVLAGIVTLTLFPGDDAVETKPSQPVEVSSTTPKVAEVPTSVEPMDAKPTEVVKANPTLTPDVIPQEPDVEPEDVKVPLTPIEKVVKPKIKKEPTITKKVPVVRPDPKPKTKTKPKTEPKKQNQIKSLKLDDKSFQVKPLTL